MRVNWVINLGTDHCKDGTRPYDLAFPFHSLKFNRKRLIPESKKHFHYYFKVYAVVSGSISNRFLLGFFNWKSEFTSLRLWNWWDHPLDEVIGCTVKIVYYLGSLARMGLQKRKFLIQTSRDQHHCVCFSTNVYGLHTCGYAEACLSSYHFYLMLWLPYLVKNIYIFRMCLWIDYILV